MSFINYSSSFSFDSMTSLRRNTLPSKNAVGKARKAMKVQPLKGVERKISKTIATIKPRRRAMPACLNSIKGSSFSSRKFL